MVPYKQKNWQVITTCQYSVSKKSLVGADAHIAPYESEMIGFRQSGKNQWQLWEPQPWLPQL